MSNVENKTDTRRTKAIHSSLSRLPTTMIHVQLRSARYNGTTPLRTSYSCIGTTDRCYGMEELMPGSTQLIPRPNPRTPRRQSRIKQQVDVHSLALEVQTVLLMLGDLRRRLSELEKKFNTDKITDADRGLLKNVDRKFGKPSTPQLLLSGPECSPPSSPVRAARHYR